MKQTISKEVTICDRCRRECFAGVTYTCPRCKKEICTTCLEGLYDVYNTNVCRTCYEDKIVQEIIELGLKKWRSDGKKLKEKLKKLVSPKKGQE